MTSWNILCKLRINDDIWPLPDIGPFDDPTLVAQAIIARYSHVDRLTVQEVEEGKVISLTSARIWLDEHDSPGEGLARNRLALGQLGPGLKWSWEK